MQTNFLSVVQMFHMQAMMGMGKLMNPMTGVVERNLEQARFCIDVLGVLEEKTKNNLTNEEQRVLSYALQDLRLNFVAEEAKAEDEAGQTQQVQAADTTAEQDSSSKETE
jgi:hypothetical protein